MVKGKIRHMFAGGNTSKGFYSFFNNIIDRESAKRLFILKGGPGVGKSTFMRKTAAELLERGYDVEFMHCSSDNGSLDGVVIPSIGVAMIDGTAPHTVDPKYPGVIDEIINLGDYWDGDGIVKHRQEIADISDEVGRIFAGAYRYLMAAHHIYEDSAQINERFVDKSKINSLVKELIDDILLDAPLSQMMGRHRCLFASAITPDGFKDYLDDLLVTDNVYILEGFPGSGTEKLLERIKNAACERGFYSEGYYCAFNPDKLEHLVIPDIKTSFTTANKYHSTDACSLRKIDFGNYLDERVEAYRSKLSYNQSIIDCLFNKTIENIHSAKMLHDKLETYYIPNMDFEAVKNKWRDTMNRIEKYIP